MNKLFFWGGGMKEGALQMQNLKKFEIINYMAPFNSKFWNKYIHILYINKLLV